MTLIAAMRSWLRGARPAATTPLAVAAVAEPMAGVGPSRASMATTEDADATLPGPLGPPPTLFETGSIPTPATDIQGDFSALVLGTGRLRSGAPSAAERRMLRQIDILVHGQDDAHLVPRLPAILPQLMALARRDDVPPREVAERLARDPTLVGEVVRLANAGRHGGRPIANLQDAVMMLGQRGLHQLVARVAMRPIYGPRQGRFSVAAGSRVWDVTERIAQACATACKPPADPFQGYLAGLVANVGMIAALRALDIGYHEPSPPDSAEFHHALHDTVAQLSARIARGWNFPEPVCMAVDRLGGKDDAGSGSLAAALRLADRASKRHLLSPGLDAAALAVLPDAERSCYAALDLAFGTAHAG